MLTIDGSQPQLLAPGPLRPVVFSATNEGPGFRKGILLLGIIVVAGVVIYGFGGAGAFDPPRHRDYDDFNRKRRSHRDD